MIRKVLIVTLIVAVVAIMVAPSMITKPVYASIGFTDHAGDAITYSVHHGDPRGEAVSGSAVFADPAGGTLSYTLTLPKGVPHGEPSVSHP